MDPSGKTGFARRVSDCFDLLTHTQHAVADYALEHMDRMAFSTLDDLAERIPTSTASIIRFAKAVGYTGYAEMQKALQSELVDKVSLPERFSSAAATMERDELLSAAAQNCVSNITGTLALLRQEDLDAAVEKLARARTVYVLGLRSSFALAHYAASRLGQVRGQVRLIQSAGMLFPEELVGCGSGDVCLAHLFPRYSKTAANLILWLQRRGVQVVLITSPNHAAVRQYGDVLLPCQVKGISFKNSLAAPLFLLDYLATAVSMKDRDRALETLRQTEDFLSRGYYLGL